MCDRFIDDVITALDKCSADLATCNDCPYDGLIYCGDLAKKDAVKLLKEYREIKKDEESAYQRGFRDGQAKQAEDDEVARRWDESFRASQMPWNHGCEMGG